MKNKKRVLKSKWQKVLEFIAVTSLLLIVSTADSEWTIEYFRFLGILIGAFTLSVAIIYKFCDLSKYQ
jgi:hypothetical protein